MLRELLDGGIEVADRGAPRARAPRPGEGSATERWSVTRDVARPPHSPTTADDRRVQLVEQRCDRRLGAAFGLDHRHAVRQERLAVDEPRDLREVGSRRRQRRRANDEHAPPELFRERLRNAEPRVDVLAVDPEDHARRREPSAVCASSSASAALRRREHGLSVEAAHDSAQALVLGCRCR